MATDEEKERSEEWNKPRVVFLSYKEQFILASLIRKVQKEEWKDVKLLYGDSVSLQGIYDRIRKNVAGQMGNLKSPKEEEK